jgi:predicted ABC-type sugar transport system permease subunit
MFLDHLVIPALAVAVTSMVVLFTTRLHFPRVAGVASMLMAASLGIMFLWAAVQMITTGVSEGRATTMFRQTVQRSESPFAFWGRVAVFGVPALLLVGAPLVVSVKYLFSRFVRGKRKS